MTADDRRKAGLGSRIGRLAAALAVAALAGAACDAPARDNPLDSVHLDQGQDPYGLTATFEAGAIRLAWERLDVASLDGYWLYRVADAGEGSRLEILGFVEQPPPGQAPTFRDETVFAAWVAYSYYLKPQGVSGLGEPSAAVLFAPTGDLDGDGFIGDDCGANVASIHPGAVEVCNGADDDCNGAIDDAADCARP